MNPTSEIVQNRVTDLDFLAPICRANFRELLIKLCDYHLDHKTPFIWKAFETWRHPERQDFVHSQRKSGARAMQSPHQYGLAMDVVPRQQDAEGNWHWTWDVDASDWRFMHETAKDCGLIAPLQWDKAHIEHPIWREDIYGKVILP